MNKWILFAVFVLSSPPRLGAEETNLGKAYFKGYGCIRCHRVAGNGGVYGPDLTFVGFRKTPEWLDLWLKNPHNWKSNTAMPNFNLPDSVRRSLVNYLTSLQGQAYRNNPPWNDPALMSNSAKRGEEIFNRAGCVGCHGKRGVGGYPNNNVVGGKIPTLTKVSDGYSKEELENKIRSGVPKSQKADIKGEDPKIFMPSWGKVLKDDEIDALADYLISLKPKKSGEDW